MHLIRKWTPLIRRGLAVTCLFWGVQFTLRAQNEQITFSSPEIRLGSAINEIANQTRLKFVFENGIIDPETRVSFPERTLYLTDALDSMLEGKDIGYVIEDRYIILVPRQRSRPVAVQPAARTSDRYTPGDINDPQGRYMIRPDWLAAKPDSAVGLAVQPDPVPIPETPSYSAYTDPDIYSPIRHSLPRTAIKTNLLYAAATLTPNVGVEFSVGPRKTLEITGSYNPWNWEGDREDNRKRVHYLLQSELRWWKCERFSGHFLGVHAMYINYNVGRKDLPLLFDKEFQYEGWALGAGVSYGYSLALDRRWSVEFTVGLGAAYRRQDKYKCGKCGTPMETEDKFYFGPTKLGVNLVFLFK